MRNIITLLFAGGLLLAVGATASAPGSTPVPRVPGRNGQALQLASGEYAVSNATEELNIDRQLTMAFWVKAEEWGHMSSLVFKVGSYGIMKRGDLGVFFRAHFHQWDGIDLTWVPEKYQLETGKWYRCGD